MRTSGAKLAVSVLIIAVVALTCITSTTRYSGFNAQGFALLRSGGLPVIIDSRLQTFSFYGNAFLRFHERIINSSMQRPPPIPKPVTYPGRPGTVVLAVTPKISKYYLLGLGLKFQYVIITSKPLIPYLYPLAVIHASQGMNVLITTVSWVEAEFKASAPPKSIRLFARFAHYSLGADYLLLGGDVNVVPTAYWYAQQVLKSVGEGPYKATDQYYAFLDGTWDPNHDGKLLECLNESGGNGIILKVVEPLPDAVPDLYVGRLPASNSSQMAELVNAEIKYLTNPPEGRWLRRAYLLAGIANLKREFNVSVPEVDMATVAQYVMKDFLRPAGFRVVRAYEDVDLSRTSYPHELNLSRAVADELFRNGSLVVFSAGHGNQLEQGMPVWINDSNGDGIPDDHEIKFTAFLKVGDDLSNNGKRSLTYFEGCLIGFYDYDRDSLSEYVLRHAAIAVIASSRTSYYQVPWPGPGGWLDQELAYLFWKALTGSANWTVGPALELSKYYYIKEHGGDPALLSYMSLKDILNYNLLGDPALRVWYPPPKVLREVLNTTTVMPGEVVKVRVAGAGAGIPKALVALYGNASRGLLTYAYTNASGDAILKIPVDVSGTLYITVSKPGYNYGLIRLQVVGVEHPIVSIEEPAPGYYRGMVRVLAKVYDPASPLMKVLLVIRGAWGKRLIRWSALGRHEVLINTTVHVNVSGKYVLTVMAEDARGRAASKSVGFIVDNTPPEVVVSGLTNGTYVGSSGATVTIKVSSISPITYLNIALDGILLKHEANLGLNASVRLRLKSLRQGVHVLLIRVGNKVGLARTSFVTFTVDLTPPTIRIYPNISGEFVSPESVGKLTVVCNDNYVVRHIIVYLDSKEIYSGPWGRLKEVILKGLKDGMHNVTVEAVDGAGNVGREVMTFYTDSMPPTIKLSGIANGTYTRAREVTVKALVSDDLWLYNVTIYVNGRPVRHYLKPPSAGGGLNRGPVTLVIPINTSVGGRYVVNVLALDAAGNRASAEISFIADHTPPKLAVVSGPANGSIVNSTLVKLKVRVSDNACLLEAYASVNGEEVARLGNGVSTLAVPTPANGRYVIRLYAIDCAGNKAFLTEEITADHTPPEIRILSPAQNTYCRAPVEVEARITDNLGVREVTVLANGRVVGTAYLKGSEGVVSLAITGLSNGQNVITVKAVDEAGNTRVASVKVFVDNSPPKLELVNASREFITVRPEELTLKIVSNESLSMLKAFLNGVPAKVVRLSPKLWEVLIPGKALKYGTNEVYIVGKDLAGNPASLATYVTLLRRMNSSWSVPTWVFLLAVVAAVVACITCVTRGCRR